MITLGGCELPLSKRLILNFAILILGLGLLAVEITATGLVHTRSLRASAPIAFAVFYSSAQVKSKIELELEKKEAANKKPEITSKGKPPVRSATASPKSRRLNEATITIVSDVPGAEIGIDGSPVGKIDESKKLTIRVKKGHHTATASLKGYNPQVLTISVFADRSSHTINLGKPIPPPAALPSPAPKVALTTDALPSPPPPTADDIIRRFIDPSETTKLRAEDWSEVISQSEEGLKKEPTNAQIVARLHLARGQVAYLNRNYAESLSEFNRAIEALPRSGIAYYGLGNAYMATNQPLQANKTYQKATELTPEMAAVAQKGIGDAFTKLGRKNEANASYRRARDLGYVSPELNKSIAVNLIQDKQWQKALSELSAIEDTNSSAEIQLYLGECYENLKRPLSAYRAYATASKLDPNSPVAFSKLGTLLYEHNEFADAKEAYERALALDTTGKLINRQLIRKLADKAASLAK
jgi:tetratricopeptide (TPR) repeat protein